MLGLIRLFGIISMNLLIVNPGFTQPDLESTHIGMDEKLGEFIPLELAFLTRMEILFAWVIL